MEYSGLKARLRQRAKVGLFVFPFDRDGSVFDLPKDGFGKVQRRSSDFLLIKIVPQIGRFLSSEPDFRFPGSQIEELGLETFLAQAKRGGGRDVGQGTVV